MFHHLQLVVFPDDWNGGRGDGRRTVALKEINSEVTASLSFPFVGQTTPRDPTLLHRTLGNGNGAHGTFLLYTGTLDLVGFY